MAIISLQVWLPLNGNLNNNGLSDAQFTTSTATISANGKMGECYNLSATDGNGIYLNSGITNADFMNNYINYHSWTLCAWIKSTATDTCVIGLTYGLRMFAGTNPSISLYNADRSVACQCSLSTTDGKWHHIASTYNADTNEIRIYIDGVCGGKAQYTDGYTYYSSWTNTIAIGRDSNNTTANAHYYYQGDINDVRIYDNCLSAKEIKEISKALILHYPLNQAEHNDNLIQNSINVASGSNASGITSSYLEDGTLRIIAESGNSNYRSCGFGSMTSTNVQNAMSVGDKFVISFDLMIVNGSGIPTCFINSGNGYESMVGNPNLVGQWQRVYKVRTWAEPGTSYGYISLHLGFSSCEGIYYVKNFKMEKGDCPTIWTPSSTDTINWNDNTEYDTSGYKNNGITNGTINLQNNSPRYDYCYKFGSDGYINVGSASDKMPTDAITVSCWAYLDDWNITTAMRMLSCTESGGWQLSINDTANNLCVPIYRAGIGYQSTLYPLANIKAGWHLCSFTFNGTNTILYLDANEVSATSTDSCSIGYNATAPLLVSGEPNGSTYTGCSFTGKLSDIRIYATALSSADIRELYNTPISVTSNGTLMLQGEVIE